MDEAKDERYLRDTLTILHERLPKRRRVDESIDDGYEGRSSSSDNVGRELIQEQRKACLRELIPVILGGPFAFNKHNSSGSNDGFEKDRQEEKDTAATAADISSSLSASAPVALSSEVDENKNKNKILDEAKVEDSNKMDVDEPVAKHNVGMEKEVELKGSSTEDDKISSNIEKDDAKLAAQEDVISTVTAPVASRLDYYKKELEFVKAQNEEFAKERLEKFRKYAHLLAGYEYGLKHVSKLIDLSNAPDNILDGNFPKKQSSSISDSNVTTIAASPGATVTSA
eukprot:CAMPEP_0194092400 /NCGR_PEP_ID=MMETSP0149-20130528/46623_1 /TAXON_ID=122233 /ORGANISM="Chaetoceros debilis, Strain MM31A-1" /LENGTH=283 /DNA_ID=CAMNT_0038777341 /DNA_START=1 /DNA_END=849 /DNA_ORIENTATION=-